MSYFAFFCCCFFYILAAVDQLPLLGYRELICLKLFTLCFLLERFPLPLGAWDGLPYFLWPSLTEPSI